MSSYGLARGLARSVVEGLQRLPGPWAVRSSATVEDGVGLAFAGVFTSVLGVLTPDSVIQAIGKVAAGRRAGTVKYYAAHHGVNIGDVEMAVVVQTMIPATLGGVMFSSDVVRGSESTLIEASYGLPEPIVAGTITPDSIEVSTDRQVNVCHIGTKHETAVLEPDGRVGRVRTPETKRSTCSITTDMALRLADLSKDVERRFNAPQDIEWAAVNDVIFLLQARPITASLHIADADTAS